MILNSLEPSASPEGVTGHNSSSTSILVQWNDVKQDEQNGNITGYKVMYKALPSGSDETETVNASTKQLNISGLNEFTDYSIRVLAFTVIGDGPLSSAITVRTDEDSMSCSLLSALSLFVCPVLYFVLCSCFFLWSCVCVRHFVKRDSR